MRRRKFMAVLCGAVAWPMAARAQQPVPVIGFLGSGSPETWRRAVAAVRQGLADTGYTDGRNVTIEYRWAEDHYDRLPAMAAELVRRQVAVIVAPGSVVAAAAAKAATTAIPIVFMVGSDPIEAGIVTNLSHPGSNLTGVAYLNVEVAAKRLDLLQKAVPAATSVTLLVNPTNAIEADIQTKELRTAARTLDIHLRVLHATDLAQTEGAFETIGRDGGGTLQLGVDPLFAHVREVVGMAARHSVPTIYPWREFTAAGGLMSYGAVILDAFRQVGVYAGKILSGEKAANLPVQRPTKLGFVINLKTASALGIALPTDVLNIADELIE